MAVMLHLQKTGSDVQLTVLTDRSQGGASIKDGQLELMVSLSVVCVHVRGGMRGDCQAVVIEQLYHYTLLYILICFTEQALVDTTMKVYSLILYTK